MSISGPSSQGGNNDFAIQIGVIKDALKNGRRVVFNISDGKFYSYSRTEARDADKNNFITDLKGIKNTINDFLKKNVKHESFEYFNNQLKTSFEERGKKLENRFVIFGRSIRDKAVKALKEEIPQSLEQLYPTISKVEQVRQEVLPSALKEQSTKAHLPNTQQNLKMSSGALNDPTVKQPPKQPIAGEGPPPPPPPPGTSGGSPPPPPPPVLQTLSAGGAPPPPGPIYSPLHTRCIPKSNENLFPGEPTMFEIPTGIDLGKKQTIPPEEIGSCRTQIKVYKDRLEEIVKEYENKLAQHEKNNQEIKEHNQSITRDQEEYKQNLRSISLLKDSNQSATRFTGFYRTSKGEFNITLYPTSQLSIEHQKMPCVFSLKDKIENLEKRQAEIELNIEEASKKLTELQSRQTELTSNSPQVTTWESLLTAKKGRAQALGQIYNNLDPNKKPSNSLTRTSTQGSTSEDTARLNDPTLAPLLYATSFFNTQAFATLKGSVAFDNVFENTALLPSPKAIASNVTATAPAAPSNTSPPPPPPPPQPLNAPPPPPPPPLQAAKAPPPPPPPSAAGTPQPPPPPSAAGTPQPPPFRPMVSQPIQETRKFENEPQALPQIAPSASENVRADYQKQLKQHITQFEASIKPIQESFVNLENLSGFKKDTEKEIIDLNKKLADIETTKIELQKCLKSNSPFITTTTTKAKNEIIFYPQKSISDAIEKATSINVSTPDLSKLRSIEWKLKSLDKNKEETSKEIKDYEAKVRLLEQSIDEIKSSKNNEIPFDSWEKLLRTKETELRKLKNSLTLLTQSSTNQTQDSKTTKQSVSLSKMDEITQSAKDLENALGMTAAQLRTSKGREVFIGNIKLE